MLFDTGRQQTYISNSLKLKLKLPVLRTENLVFQVIRKGKDITVSKVDIVKLKVFCKLTNDYIFIEAVSIPNISSPLKNQEISYVQKNCKHLRLKSLYKKIVNI